MARLRVAGMRRVARERMSVCVGNMMVRKLCVFLIW